MTLFSKRSHQPVPVELLGAAAEAIAALPDEGRKNPTRRVIAILHMFDAHKVPSADRSDLLTGIQFRLQALGRLQDQPSYRAWSRKKIMHAVLVEAAASAPLLMTRRIANFEPQSFFQRVCAISKARGVG
jgi:hypothetical protein